MEQGALLFTSQTWSGCRNLHTLRSGGAVLSTPDGGVPSSHGGCCLIVLQAAQSPSLSLSGAGADMSSTWLRPLTWWLRGPSGPNAQNFLPVLACPGGRHRLSSQLLSLCSIYMQDARPRLCMFSVWPRESVTRGPLAQSVHSQDAGSCCSACVGTYGVWNCHRLRAECPAPHRTRVLLPHPSCMCLA